jgi:DNA polymerase III delta prime subunit
MEKYRPRKVDECILPKNLKETFLGIVNGGKLPHMLLCGSAGIGKTTVAKALCEELEYSNIVINASDDRNIDTLRTTVKQFASGLSFNGKRKVIILDEADYLNCLDEDELVKLSDGTSIKLKDMQMGKKYHVVSFNMESKKFENNYAEVVNKTTKMTYTIELDCGKTITCTDDHPLICEDSNGNIVMRTIAEGLEGYKIIIQK